MEGCANERDELRRAFPLWLIGAAVLLVALARRRPLLAFAGAGAVAYQGRPLVERVVRTVRVLMRRTHDETAA